MKLVEAFVLLGCAFVIVVCVLVYAFSKLAHLYKLHTGEWQPRVKYDGVFAHFYIEKYGEEDIFIHKDIDTYNLGAMSEAESDTMLQAYTRNNQTKLLERK